MSFGQEHRAPSGRVVVRAITDIDRIRELSADERRMLKQVISKYPFRVNSYYLSLIDWADPADPLRRLVIPHELELTRWGQLDACNEQAVTVCPGVQHKYGSTVLILLTDMCACFCRYCFRKRIFQPEHYTPRFNPEQALEYIREHPEVNNVLLTGGDPLVLSTARLRTVIRALREIEHVRIIRIGTKIPAFNPYRIIYDQDLLKLFRQNSLPNKRIYMICHFDHPHELTPASRRAIALLQDANVVCLNQSPIIRGVSDDPAVLSRLWNELSFLGVSQYYIFQGRPTSGNKIYNLPLTEAYGIIEQARSGCSGLAKRTRFVMSHASGKIEIIGLDDKYIYLKYHRAQAKEDNQRFMKYYRDDGAVWLDELVPADRLDKSPVSEFSLITLRNPDDDIYAGLWQ